MGQLTAGTVNVAKVSANKAPCAFATDGEHCQAWTTLGAAPRPGFLFWLAAHTPALSCALTEAWPEEAHVRRQAVLGDLELAPDKNASTTRAEQLGDGAGPMVDSFGLFTLHSFASPRPVGLFACHRTLINRFQSCAVKQLPATSLKRDTTFPNACACAFAQTSLHLNCPSLLVPCSCERRCRSAITACCRRLKSWQLPRIRTLTQSLSSRLNGWVKDVVAAPHTNYGCCQQLLSEASQVTRKYFSVLPGCLDCSCCSRVRMKISPESAMVKMQQLAFLLRWARGS